MLFPPSLPRFPSRTTAPAPPTNSTISPSLPSEIILHILSHLPPGDLDSMQTLCRSALVSKAFAQLAAQNQAWAPQLKRWKNVTSGLDSPPLREDEPGAVERDEDTASRTWRIDNPLSIKLFVTRRVLLDRQAKELVIEMAKITHGRRKLVADAVDLGEEVEEQLERLSRIGPEQDEGLWLAVRFWSTTALQSLRRRMSLNYWSKVIQEWIASRTDQRLCVDGFNGSDIRLLLSFEPFVNNDPQSIKDKLTEIDSVKLSAGRLSSIMSLEDMVEELWSTMGKVGYHEVFDDGAYGVTLSEILQTRSIAEISNTDPMGIPTNVIALLLCFLISTLPWAIFGAYPITFASDHTPLVIQAFRLSPNRPFEVVEIVYYDLNLLKFLGVGEVRSILRQEQNAGDMPVSDSHGLFFCGSNKLLLESLSREMRTAYFRRANGPPQLPRACGAVLAIALTNGIYDEPLFPTQREQLRSYPYRWEVTSLRRYFTGAIHEEDYQILEELSTTDADDAVPLKLF